MRIHPSNLRTSKVRATLAIAAQLLLTGGVLLVTAAAQETETAPEETAAPPPAVFQNRIPADQLSFLNDYAGHSEKELRKDKRFRSLMKQVTPRTEYHYGRDMPLSDTSETLLDGPPLPVEIREGRYAMVGSHGGPYLDGRGFVWFDMKEGIGIGGVFFHPVNGEPTPTLALFSTQLTDTSLGMSQFPQAFAGDLIQWATEVGIPPVTARYFIPANGKKYVLLHDEDYCSSPENPSAPRDERCEKLNADAADADMNAAYFMQETHNQANATAWMLGPDQVAWIGLREQRCGGANPFGCRIRMARERTRVLIGRGRR